MPYLGNGLTSNFASVTKDLFSGDGSTVAFTLSKASTTNGVAVFVENVRQEPTIAYAVSGTTLTFTAAPVTSSGNNIYVLHHNAPASTANHPAAQSLTAVNGTFTGNIDVDGTTDLDGLTSSTDVKLLKGDSSAISQYFQNSSTGSSATDGVQIALGSSEDFQIWNYENTALTIATNNTERLRIDDDGNIIAGGTSEKIIYDDSSGNSGPILHSANRLDIARNDACIIMNSTASGAAALMDIRRVGSTIGTVAHDGSGTVSYNAFTGCHWGRLSNNSKPTILKGTILETIDEMCDWYEVEFTVPEVKYVDGDALPNGKKVGDVKTEAKGKNYLIPLADIGSKKVGDSFTFTYKEDGVEYTGTLKLQDDEKHSKCKVSDTADSKKVYGVFFSWDSVDDGYNDMYVAGLGTYVVRVHKDVAVESGDLLVSNGDGTAKVQDDDIIRSKTVAKVLANVKQETHSDGSYTVPCALYCG